MKWPKSVTINEVGPRDGLQNEKKLISTDDKIYWINQLSNSGLKYIEVSSFVNPKWIPALADAKEVAKGIKREPGIIYAALVPNQRGLEYALETKIDRTAIFMSASEKHNLSNINKSIDDTFPVLREVVKDSLAASIPVRGYVSTVFGCPYEGEVSIDSVIRVAENLFEMGIYELSLGDTIGVANPAQVQNVLEAILKRFPKEKIALHFHDTRGTALANIVAALDMGITSFDSSVGGLGGCPYAPGASGNVATDDLIYMFEGMGIETGVNLNQILRSAKYIQKRLGRQLPSHNLQVSQGTVL